MSHVQLLAFFFPVMQLWNLHLGICCSTMTFQCQATVMSLWRRHRTCVIVGVFRKAFNWVNSPSDNSDVQKMWTGWTWWVSIWFGPLWFSPLPRNTLEAITKRLVWRRLLLFFLRHCRITITAFFCHFFFCSPPVSPGKSASHICSPARRHYWLQAVK